MVPAPTTAAVRISSGRGVFGNAGNLGGFAFGEKQADQVAGFGGEHAIGEQLDFARGSGVEAPLDTGRDGVDGGVRSVGAARSLLQAGARRLDRGGCHGVIGDLGFLLADFARFSRRSLGAREGDGASKQVAIHNMIDDAFGQRALGCDVLAERTHFDGRGHAAEPRQALRASRAGDDAQQHFRLADLGAGHGHAIVAGHGEFETAAQRGAVDGAHHRLGTILDAPQQRVDAMRTVDGNVAVRNRAEDLDIGSGDECIARADQHHGFHGRIGRGARHTGIDAFRHAGAQGVNRRIVYGHDRDVFLDGILNEFWHGMMIRSIMAL